MFEEEKVEQVVEQAVEQPVENPVDQVKKDNLIKMRLKLEAAEEAAKEAQKRAEEAERRYAQRPPVEEFDAADLPDDPFDIEDEDFVQAKHVKKTTKNVQNKLKQTESALQQIREELSILRAEKATEKMPDFNEVVSTDNLKTLQRLYPDEYETLMANPNLKSKSIVAYNMMQRYGIVEAKSTVKREENIRAVDKKIEENRLKPGSVAMAKSSSSPLTNASRYDADGRLVLSDSDRDAINIRVKQKLGII